MFRISSAVFISLTVCFQKKTPEAEMVVEDGSSPINEVTSRTELDVTEEAANELVEPEDE